MFERERIFSGRFVNVEIDPATGHEVVVTADSVAILIYIRDRDQVVLVAQQRPAIRSPFNVAGASREVIAGRIDKPGKTAREIIAEEAKEEAGITILPREIQPVNYHTAIAVSPGVMSEEIILMYAEIDSSAVDWSRDEFAHGSERTTRLCISVADLESGWVPLADLKTFALVQWLLYHRATSAKGKEDRNAPR